jgi:hypothetical protein
MENIFGDIIYSYSREQAIEDGVLVNLPEHITRQYFKFPVAITSSVWHLIEMAIDNLQHQNSLEGVLCDILWMSQRGITKRIDESQHLFQVIITGVGKKRNHTLKIMCHPGDQGEPVLTVMMPEED